MSMSKNKSVLAGVAAGLVAGVVGTTVVARLLREKAHGTVGPGASAGAGSPEHKIAFYRSPMNAADTSPVPRKDAMGMDFVPVYQDEAAGHSEVSGLAEVQIDAQRQQLIGLR